MSLRVIHVVTTIDLGGAEKQLLMLAACQKTKGLEVEVIYLKGTPTLLNDFLDSGILVHTDFIGLNLYQQIRKLKNFRLASDVVFHAHLPRAELLCSLSLRRGDYVVTRHNAEPFFPSAPKLVSILLSRFVLSRSFASISISKAVLDYLKRSLEVSAVSKNYVIYYGVPNTSVTPAKTDLPFLENLRIGTIARHAHQKNIPLLLEALKALTEQKKFGGELFIVGAGPLTEELKLLARNLELESSVTWLAKTRNVVDFYKSLDFFILTSNYEGFGLVLLEAMQQGVPIIARKTSAIPEVLGEHHPGLVQSVNPNDYARRIIDMIEHPDLLLQCLDSQRRQLALFSINTTEISYRHLYERLTSEKRQNCL